MTRHSRRITSLGIVALALASTAWAQAPRSVYERLGGRAAIVTVVDDFVANCAADTRINAFFAATAADQRRLAVFKNHLVDQICEATGGPCKYTGRDMKSAHAGLGIGNADFDALVEDLTRALDKSKVGKGEQSQILGILGPMRSQVVEKK